VLGAKLELRNAKDIADLKAAVQCVILVPAAARAAVAMQKAQTWYSAEVQGKGGKHGQGQQDFHSFRAMLAVLIADSTNERNKSTLQEALAKCSTLAGMAGKVVVCVCSKTGKDEVKKISLSLRGSFEALEESILEELAAIEGADLRFGRGPRTEMERQMQSRLDKLVELRKKK